MWRGTKSQSLNVSPLVLQLPLPNPRSQVLSQEWRCSWSSVDSGCTCLAPSHYLLQCWVIVNWTPRNKFQRNLSKNKIVFIKKNAFENDGCKMVTILSWPQSVQMCFHTFALFMAKSRRSLRWGWGWAAAPWSRKLTTSMKSSRQPPNVTTLLYS